MTGPASLRQHDRLVPGAGSECRQQRVGRVSQDSNHAHPVAENVLDRALGLVAHSDRGSQYASEHYRRVLAGAGMVCSMSRWGNAPVESFVASLKKELVHDEDYATQASARASIFEYIEVFFNRVRRHSTLRYLIPLEYGRTHK